jgi:hypothetical protein
VIPTVEIDLDGLGVYTDLSADVQHVAIRIGGAGTVADAGMCAITFYNADRRYSPDYAASPYHNRIKPGRTVRVKVGASALFTGAITDIAPESDSYGRRACIVTAEDRIGTLAHTAPELPLQENVRSDELVRRILNGAFGMAAASGSLPFAGVPSAGNWVSLNGVTYIFRVNPTLPNEIKIGATVAECLDNLAAAINGAEGAGSIYAANSTRAPGVVAIPNAPALTIRAILRGAVGNGYTLASSGGVISVDAMSGGVDAPSLDLHAGDETFDTAGDTWLEVDALQAIRDVVDSERGRFYSKGDGTLIFENRSDTFAAVAATPVLTLNGELSAIEGGMSTPYKRVRVEMMPRSTATVGAVVARADGTTLVPGRQGGSRFDPNAPISPESGLKVIQLPFRDEFGNPIGAKDLILPLVPGTDWTANERADGSGTDYTFYAPQQLFFSAVIKGASVELSIRNDALGPLYIRKLQVRGTGITAYNAQTVIADDPNAAGVLVRKVFLPLASRMELAQSLAVYLIGQTPRFSAHTLIFRNIESIGGVNLADVPIGAVITVSEPQTAISGHRYRVAGAEYEIGAETVIRWRVIRLDDVTYCILDHPAYGVLDQTARLAV